MSLAQLIGLMFLQIGGFFLIGQDPRRTFCSNAITLATQYTNRRCSFQGFIVIFGAMASVMTILTRLLQLHLQVVWEHDLNGFKGINRKVATMILVPYVAASTTALIP